jgi:hypothetical protein
MEDKITDAAPLADAGFLLNKHLANPPSAAFLKRTYLFSYDSDDEAMEAKALEDDDDDDDIISVCLDDDDDDVAGSEEDDRRHRKASIRADEMLARQLSHESDVIDLTEDDTEPVLYVE